MEMDVRSQSLLSGRKGLVMALSTSTASPTAAAAAVAVPAKAALEVV